MSDIMLHSSSDQVMTLEELKKKVSFAFLSEPSRKVSTKYVHVPTSRVVEDLIALGWQPVNGAQRKAKVGKSSVFSKHMIKFQNPDIVIKGQNGDDVYPQIILTNSHDGATSFKFMMGLYRVVCTNGLVVADEQFANFKMRHMGYSFEDLQELVSKTVEELPNKVQVINQMKTTSLTIEQQKELALKAYLLRKGIAIGDEGSNVDDETLEAILEPRREQDKGDDLWLTFNRVQEAITQGGFMAALTGAKVRKVRKIHSFEKDLKLNQELFQVALEYVA
jgi:hypothetical protein